LDTNKLIYAITGIMDDRYICHFLDFHVEFIDIQDRTANLFLYLPALYYSKKGYKLVKYGNKFKLIKK